MAVFPKVQSPCPYKGELSSIMDGDICRLCKRQVFDLSDMADRERVEFLSSCAGEVCVSYKFPVRRALAAAMAVAALTAPMPAAAQQYEEVEEIIVGGIKDPANVEYVDPADNAVPELPVLYEDAADADKAVGGQTPSPQAQDAAGENDGGRSSELVSSEPS